MDKQKSGCFEQAGGCCHKVFHWALTAFTVLALTMVKLFQGVYRGLAAASAANGAKLTVESKSRKVWLNVKLPWARNPECPHCESPLDPEQDLPLCPQCYGDLQHPCPDCGEAVAIHRKVCPACRADLRTVQQR